MDLQKFITDTANAHAKTYKASLKDEALRQEDLLHEYKKDQQDAEQDAEDYNREQNAKWLDDSEG